MQTKRSSRREFLGAVGAVAAVALAAIPFPVTAAEESSPPKLKIGIIGAGRIGGTLAGLWLKAGHEVMLSARNLDPVKKLTAGLGPLARVGTPKEAAAFGDAVLISVPYGALPQIGRDLASELNGKVVLDTCNPSQTRDGSMAVAAKAKGTGLASAEYLPGVRLVRAFNSVGYTALRSETNRPGDKVGIPLAGDDQEALAVAAQLVQDAGFEPVVVGPLTRAKDFDMGTPVYGKALTAPELRRALNLPS